MFSKEELQAAVVQAAADRGHGELVQQLGEDKANELLATHRMQVVTLGIILSLNENLVNHPELGDDDEEIDPLFESVVQTAYPQAYEDKDEDDDGFAAVLAALSDD